MRKRFSSAMVTGASSGIGRAFATELASGGTNLVLVARRGQVLEELAAHLREAHGVRITTLACDLTEDKDLSRLEQRLSDADDNVELLVSNAGAGTAGRFADLPVDGELASLGVNVTACVRLVSAALPGMLQRGQGGIVTVSSMVASMPMPTSATYGATKAFLSSWTESLHLEVRNQGVNVTCVEAGLTHTGFHEAAGIDRSDLPRVGWTEPSVVARAGLRAVCAGRPRVVPGTMNRLQGPMLKMMPRPLLRSVVARMYQV